MIVIRRLLYAAVGVLVFGGIAVSSFGSTGQATEPAKAYFAGGCFWCMEEAFEAVDGVVSVVSGYMGGTVANPTYAQVSGGGTGHAETVEVRYDPNKVSYRQLLDVFWRNVDPLTPNAQFCDHGTQYRSAVFYGTEDEKRLAEESQAAIERSQKFSQPIVTQLVNASTFYQAEDAHQDYYKTHSIRYKYYKFNCGRAKRLEVLWGKP